MSKNNKPFVMPGADGDDEDYTPLDLSFTEQTDDEKEAEAKLQEAKDALKAEADAEEAEKQRLKDEAAALAAEEDKAEKAATEDKKDEPTEDEKKLAADLEKNRADKDKGKKQPMVPKSRLDEVLAKNREMAEQLKQATAAREAASPKPEKDAVAFDFDAKEGEYMQFVLDGEKDKALAVRKEIRAAEQAEVAKTTRQTAGQDDEAMALARAAAQIEENFPQFVIGHEKHNKEATEKVVSMRDALIRGGADAVTALNDAVDFVVRKYGFDEALEGEKPGDKVVNLDDKRKKDVAKKIATQNKQPPDMSGEGERSRQQKEVSAVEQMSDAEWDALPDATRRRLRGDSL
jgi:hypothetical protein